MQDIDKLQADLIKLLDTDKEREVRLGVVNDLLVQLRQGTTVVSPSPPPFLTSEQH